MSSEPPFKTDHRPWPTPEHAWVGQMRWRYVLFAHWPVDPQLVRPHIPDELELDTYDGAAWIGVVPFDMRAKLRGLPEFGPLSHFKELNVRTYVRHNGEKPGVWFLSMDAERWLAVRAARLALGLPYFDAEMALEKEVGSVRFQSRRTHPEVPPALFSGTYRPAGEIFHSEPNTIEHFLVERYCLYTWTGSSLLRLEIHHDPWPLQPAELDVEENTTGDWLGFPLEGEPTHMHVARRLDVVAWLPEKV